MGIEKEWVENGQLSRYNFFFFAQLAVLQGLVDQAGWKVIICILTPSEDGIFLSLQGQPSFFLSDIWT